MGSVTTDTNHAVVYAEPGTIKSEIVELPMPKPGPGEIVVRIHYSGVCHTDYSFCTNAWALPSTPAGQVGGHEGAGIVASVGEGVKNLEVGARVGIKYAADACLNCERCLLGGETSCTQVKISGYYTPGTFQQYCLTTARYATPIPDGLDLAAAAPLMCAGNSVYAGLKRAETQAGNWVVVSGASGGLGHLAVQYAKALGAQVLGIDSGEKEGLCRELGVDEFIDFKAFTPDQKGAEGMRQRIHDVTSGGAHVVLMCTSSKSAYVQSQTWLRFRGRLVILGMPEGEAPSIANVALFLSEELNLIGVKAGNRRETNEALSIAARGHVKARFQLRKMKELSDVFRDMEEGKLEGRAVIDLTSV